ncbi:MAG: four helix bundle protein [Kiritimatiellae bacterium]|nr:four helix bundle protein [Kiritimatiellia bacterium]
MQEFGLEVIKFVVSLPKGRTKEIIARQLTRSATSVGANYRAACRAKSLADFISKMGTVEEEADESMYWMELIVESGMVKSETLHYLITEADELTALTVSSINTAKKNR